MALAPTTAAAATPAAPAPAAANVVAADASAASGVFSADFDTFLKLLTTQLQYQDPLQPLESTQFITQLAQFSGVEQQVATNTALGRILDSLSASGAGALGAWLGREVRAVAQAQYSGAGSVVSYPVGGPAGAESARMLVRRPDGSVAASVPFERGADSVTWDGKLTDGTQAPVGAYSFEAAYKLAGVEQETRVPAEVYARVREARRGAEDSVSLLLDGGSVVDAAKVSALRE